MDIRVKQKAGISGWPEDERPRERLLSRGSYSLTDAELLAILLRVGVKGKSAVELARDIIKHFGSVHEMMFAPISEWKCIKGLGAAKIAQLQAALEIGRRAALPYNKQKTIFKNTKQVADYFIARLSGLPEEHFRVAYLSSQAKLLEDSLIAVGTVDMVYPCVRSIIVRALQTNASAMVLAHNHPSGITSPSDSDKLLTCYILQAAKSIGIKVFEHIIVASGSIFSFADSGLLDELYLKAAKEIDLY
jgi:DNA repair protein RadC